MNAGAILKFWIGCLILTGFCSSRVSGGPATGPALQRASCVLRMETDERFGPASASEQTLTAALTSTALVDPAMQSVLKLSPGEWPRVAQVDVQPVGEAAAKLTITVRPVEGIAVPGDAAVRVLSEITSRALRSFNSGAQEPDNRTEALAKLRKERAEVDSRLAVLRTELETAYASNSRRDGGARLAMQMQIEQQIAEAKLDAGVQSAAIKVINEQLPSLDKDSDAEIKALRAKLMGLRIDAQIALAKANARAELLQARLAEWSKESATTQPTRSVQIIQSEQAELTNQRSQLDRQIASLSEQSDRRAKPKLVVVDGGAR